jgi:ligand-binding sensor domain-containing protein/signal transduction histidine kinase/DNA-binding response OmpR family regulator
MSKKAHTLFCLLLLVNLAALSQTNPIHFTALTSKDGLISNTVNAILKDSLGMMWFATDDGLNKFDGANFTVYRNNAGDTSSLRSNEVLALHEDKRGNLWIGTSGGGLSLYNRQKDNFSHFPANLPFEGFSRNGVIRSVCSDYLGKIWIAQYDGLFVLDPVSGKMEKLKLHTGRKKTTLFCVFEDSKHRMWVGTDQGLFLYSRESKSFRQFTHSDTDANSLGSDKVITITEDRNGHIWVGTVNGLARVQTDNAGISIYRYAGQFSDHEINCIVADPEGYLWIGTSQGLNRLNPLTAAVNQFVPETGHPHSLTNKYIKTAYIDNQGIYWFGTFRGGVNKYDKNLNLFNLKLSNAFDENSHGPSIITAFAENRNRHIFVGTDGSGLYEFNRTTEQMRNINMPQSINTTATAPPTILTMCMAHDNKLFIGTFAKGLFIMNAATGHMEHIQKGPGGNNLNNNDIFCLKEDSKGAIWIGTNGDGINVLHNNKVMVKYTPRPNGANEVHLPLNGYIRAIEEDRDGNMWIGSHGSGLAIYFAATHTWAVYNKDNSRLPGDKIQCILCDSQGRIWIGTYGVGLILFDKATQQFVSFSEKDGLQNTTIYQVVEDRQGRIWLSTNTGISSFDPKTKSFRNFNNQNGVQNNNFTHGSGIRLSDGTLIFGGVQGFNYFDPAKLTINRNDPAVVLTDLKISNKPVIPADESPIKSHISVASEIRLDYKQNFTLGFVALNYTIPKQNHYAYKLEGFDKDWNYTGTINTASYTNLDPGEYTFRVKAGNNDGIWSTHETTIKVFVRPPFWRTTLAYIFYVLAIAGLLLYSRYKGITRLQKKFALEQERQEVKRIQELDRLKLKFLTNLSHDFRTPISLIVGPVEQLIREAEGKLDKLQMIRRNARRLLNLVNQLLDFRKMEVRELKLQLSQGDFISFIKEVIESFRDLSERKNILFTFESELQKLPALFDHDKMERILFNLLSNAFKFTLTGGSISVALQKKQQESDANHQWVSIKVTDTGIGIPKAEQHNIFERFLQNHSASAVLNQGAGIGLSITKEFVKMHGGTITVESEPGKGSVFTILAPLALVTGQSTETGPADYTEMEMEPIPSSPALLLNDAAGVPEAISILLVEDNEDFRFYLKDNLRNNYKVLEAVNGKEGWHKALASHPQLIVSDINMPEMDGITLVKKLKADKRTSHIPVILLTAVTAEEQQLKGLETGANDYITKPFNFEVLNAKIKSLLELKSAMQSTYTKQIKVVTPEIKMESADEKLLQEIVSYLEKNITNPQLSVEGLSKQVSMSRSTLYTRLLQLTGETPVEYIRSYRLSKAASLLEKSNMTIAEVAYQVGFGTPNYFGRAFKSKFNMLPSEYVAKTRKK